MPRAQKELDNSWSSRLGPPSEYQPSDLVVEVLVTRVHRSSGSIVRVTKETLTMPGEATGLTAADLRRWASCVWQTRVVEATVSGCALKPDRPLSTLRMLDADVVLVTEGSWAPADAPARRPTLEELGIGNDATVHLLLRLRGGAGWTLPPPNGPQRFVDVTDSRLLKQARERERYSCFKDAAGCSADGLPPSHRSKSFNLLPPPGVLLRLVSTWRAFAKTMSVRHGTSASSAPWEWARRRSSAITPAAPCATRRSRPPRVASAAAPSHSRASSRAASCINVPVAGMETFTSHSCTPSLCPVVSLLHAGNAFRQVTVAPKETREDHCSIYDHSSRGGMGTWAMLSSRTWATRSRECPICLVAMAGTVAVTPCGHKYHDNCIRKVIIVLLSKVPACMGAGRGQGRGDGGCRDAEHMNTACCSIMCRMSLPAVAGAGGPLPSGQ